MDKYRRHLLIGAASCMTMPILPLRAASPLQYHLKAQRIAGDTYVVLGKREQFTRHNGGHIVNVAFIDTQEGVVVIDTGSSRKFGQALKKLIFETTGKDVIRVYNSHFHPDHCFGNQVFDPQIIAALPKTISGLKLNGEGFSDNLYRLLGDWMRGTEVTLPTQEVNFSSEKFGSHRLEMLPMSGHTDADLAILDHKTGVLFAADLCFLNRAPTTPHANFKGWYKSLQKLKAIPHKLLLPGHGPIDASGEAIEQTTRYLHWLEKHLLSSVRRGDDMIESANVTIPQEFEILKQINQELERSVAHFYPKMEAKILPLVGQGKS